MTPSKAPRAVPTLALPIADRASTRERALIATLALAGLGLVPGPAAAHAVLVASVPAMGASVAAGPLAVTLRYNSRIDRGRSKVTLLRPDSTAERLAVQAEGPADQLATSATLAPGAYTLRWQVLAIDGHITRGDVAFAVTPGDGTPPDAAPPDAAAPDAAALGAGAAPARTAGN